MRRASHSSQPGRHNFNVLHDAAMAAELGEPGAPAALIDFKLSQNARFQDRPGACKLNETAAGRGDRTMTPRLAECGANRSPVISK